MRMYRVPGAGKVKEVLSGNAKAPVNGDLLL